MHALIPLLFILLVFNSKQLKDDKLYRANIFCLVGIDYFFCIQYTIYWFRIFPTASWFRYLPGLTFTVGLVLIALSPWNKNSHPVKTTLLGSLLIAALLITFTIDYSVKEKLAEFGGYFENEPLFTAPLTPNGTTQTIQLPMLGIKLHSPNDWQQSALPSGHVYFEGFHNDKKLVEVRPNCYEGFTIDTPTYVQNIVYAYQTNGADAKYSYQCSVVDARKECLIKVRHPFNQNYNEKWHWFTVSSDNSPSMMMDVIFLTDTMDTRNQAQALIKTAKTIKKSTGEICRTPAAWL